MVSFCRVPIHSVLPDGLRDLVVDVSSTPFTRFFFILAGSLMPEGQTCGLELLSQESCSYWQTPCGSHLTSFQLFPLRQPLFRQALTRRGARFSASVQRDRGGNSTKHIESQKQHITHRSLREEGRIPHKASGMEEAAWDKHTTTGWGSRERRGPVD